jgi:transposase
VDDRLAERLVPDGLWEIVEPLIPPSPVRRQGGGRRRVDDRAVFTAIVFVLTSGCAWRYLPPTFGVPRRPRTGGSRSGPRPGCGPGCTGRCSTGSAPPGSWTGRGRSLTPRRSGRKGGSLTGPNPVDRGKAGSKLHVLVERTGLPLAVGVSAANVNDGEALQPLVPAIPAVRSRRGPRRRRPAKLHADKAYDAADLRAFLRQRRITPRIARRGVESSQRLGRRRWIVESALSWLLGRRRLTLRYERKGANFLAFLGLAAALTCYNRLAK